MNASRSVIYYHVPVVEPKIAGIAYNLINNRVIVGKLVSPGLLFTSRKLLFATSHCRGVQHVFRKIFRYVARDNLLVTHLQLQLNDEGIKLT